MEDNGISFEAHRAVDGLSRHVMGADLVVIELERQ
jgi:hypothetical protein